MGKRSNFERVERDFYPTPMEAVLPLLPHLKKNTSYFEPCAGDRTLVKHLDSHGHKCAMASDIVLYTGVDKADATVAKFYNADKVDCFITNPPWDRKILHPIIENLANQKPTWLLFDADWMHTRQSANYLKYLYKIVSVGRVKWIPDSKMTGKDNCCWYLFNKPSDQQIEFVGRTAKSP